MRRVSIFHHKNESNKKKTQEKAALQWLWRGESFTLWMMYLREISINVSLSEQLAFLFLLRPFWWRLKKKTQKETDSNLTSLALHGVDFIVVSYRLSLSSFLLLSVCVFFFVFFVFFVEQIKHKMYSVHQKLF